jgi:hypothetical protein
MGMGHKNIYFFGLDQNGKSLTEGKAEMKNLLGGKGANLAEMASLGLPVPPGFTICTDVCSHFYKNNQSYPTDLEDEVNKNIKQLEKCMSLEFGSSTHPSFGFAPWRKNAKVIGVELPCRPCHIHGPKQCPLKHHNCMKLIKAQDIYRAIEELRT